MLEVYYAPPSIYGRKVLTVLDEKNLDYEIKKLSFFTKDHLKEDYLKINPNGEIPALVDDGQVIYESTAIMEYLDEEYPEPPLMPQDSYARARVRMIDDFLDLHLHPAVRECARKVMSKSAPDEADLQKVAEGMKRMHAYLGNQSFLVEQFSLADCSFMPVIPSLVSLKLGHLLEGPAVFKRYVEGLKQRPGYKGASFLDLESIAKAMA